MNNEQSKQIIDEAYERYWNSIETSQYDGFGPTSIKLPTLTKEEFINKIKTDPEFSEKWGLKIEERELSEDERNEIRDMQYFKNRLHQSLKGSDTKINWENIPTKLITITYKDRTIESYE